jgi:hypothetical protein
VLDLDVPNTIDAVRQEMDPWNVMLFHSLGSLSFETLATQSAGRGFKVACRVVWQDDRLLDAYAGFRQYLSLVVRPMPGLKQLHGSSPR